MCGSAFPRDGDGTFAGPSIHLIKIVIGEILAAAPGPVPSTPVLMDV
ncbi:hypothetical protein [Kitasatospora sp. NPDC094011]